MYDTFGEEIWRELGPLDPDWFDVLTAQAATTEGNISDQDELCANQEGNFKTPFAVESQLFSTPKVFRHRRVVSPEIEDEQPFTAEPEKETLPWTTTSPCLFPFSKEGVPGSKYEGIQQQTEDSFDLFHTPQKSKINCGNHITESLGANIHPDISWTSSLNTPPAVPSTLILSKADERPCPVSLSEDKTVTFVQKLFPSLSNASRVGAVSPKTDDLTNQKAGADSPEAGQNPESHNSSQSSLNQSDCVWRQELPDAIKDGELRSTVASVLKGAENVLSIFFSNSSSALRKVKVDRIKRKQIISAKEQGCSSTHVATEDISASNKQRTEDQQPCRSLSSLHLQSPAKTGDMGTTQWTPLSLFEIPPSTVDTTYRNNNPVAQVENNCLTEQVQIDSHSSQLGATSLEISDSGFIKKKRRFVYTVQTSKPPVQEKESHSQGIGSLPVQKLDVKRLPNAQNEADCCNISNKTFDGKNEMRQQENLTKNLPLSVQAKVQDVDMSQLCRAFAQDFSQMSDPVKLSENPQNDFSPSACLSALKQAKHKLREASLRYDCDGVHNRRHVSATNQNNFINEGTISDSGFQSAVADISHMTANSALAPSEKDGQSQQTFQVTNKENKKVHVDEILHEAETNAKLSFVVTENQPLDPGRESAFETQNSTHPSNSAKGAVDIVNCIPLNDQVHDSLPEKSIASLPSIHASGFRTASNKGIKLSSVNLERARRLFEETEGDELRDQPTKCSRAKDDTNMHHRSVETASSDSNHPPSTSEKFRVINYQLTASQKADVTELCTLLEEADSQFEFTQLKTTTFNQQRLDNATSPQKADKELDPDFLTGIDFDDSFNLDAEKHVAVTTMPDIKPQISDCNTNLETSDVPSKSTEISVAGGMETEKFSKRNVPSFSKHIVEVSSSIMPTEHNEISKPNNNKPFSGVGFKTAGGNVMRVSKKCLSKARALFAGLEEDVGMDKKSPDKQNEKSAKSEQQDSVDNNSDNYVHHTTSTSASFRANQSSALNSFSSPLCTTSESIGASAISDLSDGGFCTASGKRVSVSSNAMKKAHLLLSEIQAHDDTEQQMKQKENSSRTVHLINHSSGFQTAGGKGLAISSAALKKADSLLRDCVEDEVCVNPKHSKIPDHGPPPRNSGFRAASGKPVTFSSEALQKAKALFDDISNSPEIPAVSGTRESDKKHKGTRNEKEKIHCGFSTAGGVKVCVSQQNLLKAKGLLKEFEPLSSPLCTEEQSSSAVVELGKGVGFCIPIRNKVSVSDDAMTKPNSLLKENATFEDTDKQLIQKRDTKQNSGFQTASGKGVSISCAALNKAKSLLSECDDAADKTSTKPNYSKMTFPGPASRNNGFLAASGKPVAFSSEALQKAKALFDDITISSEILSASGIRNTDKKLENAQNKEKIHYGFSTAGGAKVCVSQQNLLKAKNLLKEFDDHSISVKSMEEADAFFQDFMDSSDDMSAKHQKSSGSFNKKIIVPKFRNVQGVKVNISDKPGCTDANPLLNESATFEGMNKPPIQNQGIQQNGGFQTASGKGVSISSAALNKAKSLLSECDDVAAKTSAKPTHSKKPFPGPPSRNSGFLAASGKPVAFSTEALQKAKALFDDISLNTDIPAVPDTWKSDKKHEGAHCNRKVHCGFITAGGADVQMSQKNLLKAKKLLRDFDDSVSVKDGDQCSDPSSYATSPSELSRAMKRTSNSNHATTNDKDVPLDVKSHLSSQEADSENKILQNSSVHDCSLITEEARADGFGIKCAPSGEHNLHGEKRTNMFNFEKKQTSGGEKLAFTKMEETSVLFIQSLNLSGCTDTQQRFMAQEALDCTKALLEDEGLAGQSLSMPFENMPSKNKVTSNNRSGEEQKTTAKRLAEDADITAQPPLKRRLLDEFDRTLGSQRGSILKPQKSCPTSVMKDRRVFKYSVSLQPNITRPHGDGKNYIETRLQNVTHHLATGKGRSADFKISAFVPPFFKNSKTEIHQNNMVKDNRRTSTVFVPPFKRQRTTVQESSKPHEEEDERQHLSVMPSNSSAYVPPTKNTSRQSTTDVTGNKSTENIQMLALTENTKDDLVKDHTILVGCGTEGSATEASGVVNTLSRSQKIQTLQNIELARDMQDMRIRKKKRQTIRPLPGSLFLTKTSGVPKIPLKDAVNGKPPANYTQKQLYGYGVYQHVSEITSETAQSFRFSLRQFLKQEVFIDNGGVQLADGGWLIPSKNGTAGKEEFYRALCDTPGVDPKLISEEWVYNHYRWIVWKQASMERSFPASMGGLCLTPDQVLLQLKYRYDVEVDHSRRSALRKIMEQDDTAAKTLVLCVCGVVSRGPSPTRQSHNDAKTPQGAGAKAEKPCAVVWLTDGWYAIKALLDDPLTAMLHKGRLAVGGKLIINGAQLVGSQDACSPLDAPESLMLKICANSSRPARWDTKLGFYRDPRPFLLPLSSLYSNGGPVGCVDMVILRSYPIQWMERKPEGGVVFRSVRAEEKEARRFDSHKQKAMEVVLTKIQAEFEKEEKGNNKPQRRRRTISRQDIARLQDGEELYEAVGDDPTYLEAHLSDQQLETLHAYRRSLMEKKQAELQDLCRRALENAEESEGSCPKRDVTPVWRLCIADSMNRSSSVYQLNMWRPSSELQSLLKEGCRYKVYNLTTSDGKKRSDVETVQLTGTKKTQFQDLQVSQEYLLACFQARVSASFVDLQNPDFEPLCGEVDLTGYVITVIDSQGSSPAFYVVDGKLNFVKVRCFSSLAQSGLEDVLKPRVLLALSNLQLRGQSMSPTPVVYAGDLTVFSTNPKEKHLQESLGQLINLVQEQENFFLKAEEKLSYLVQSVGMSSIASPALQPRTPVVLQQNKIDRQQDTKTTVMSKQPPRSLGSLTPVSRNPAAGSCSTEKDLKSLKRRRALDYLCRIPSPPPVSILNSVASPCVNKTFNPPRRSGTASTLRTVQTPAHKRVIVPVEDEWVNDEELAMIDTQALRVGDLV